MAGYLAHLTLDEVFAVDFHNGEVKRSLGSCLTLVGESFAVTLSAYTILAALGGVCWWIVSPDAVREAMRRLLGE
jgi:hypothetical protein